MNTQNFFATANVGTIHDHAAVKASRPQQRRIKHVRTVGSRHQDDAFVRLEAVHLDQQLVQGLLALVVSAAEAGAAMASDRVDFIDEDDAGRILLALLKQIANAAGADADEHFNEVRSGDRKERNVGFAGDGTRQQGLAGSRRSDQQHAFRNASAELLELLRLAQELDNLLQLFFGLFDAGHVFKRDFLLLHREQTGAALAERQRLIAAGLHLADHEIPERGQQGQGSEQVDQPSPATVANVLHGDADVLVLELLDHLRIVRRRGGVEQRTVSQLTLDFHAGQGDLFDRALVNFRHKAGEVNVRDLLAGVRGLDHLPQRDRRNQDNYPKNYRFNG